MAFGAEPWVLLVEDDDHLRQEIARVLLSAGYRVEIAEHGEAAIDRVLAHGLPSVLLLDLIMPRMGGREFLEIFRTSEDTQGIPVILLTASTEAGELPSCFGKLLMPFAPHDMLDMVRRAFAATTGGSLPGPTGSGSH